MQNKILQSVNNYEQALNRLHEFIDEPIVNDRDRAGIIQAFEFTFELSWKTIQKIAQYEELEIGGPKTALKQAYNMNFIENEFENSWILMLKDRNLMSHTYKEDVAIDVCEHIQTVYIKAFDNLLSKLKDRFAL